MQSYKEITGRNPDFWISYKWRREGQQPLQHMRFDWRYADDASSNYMVWPEFTDENGTIFPENELVPLKGYASMWIINDKMIPGHVDRLNDGVEGYIVAGSRIHADATIIKPPFRS